MKMYSFIKPTVICLGAVLLAACSSHHGPGAGVTDANAMGGAGANGAYAQGAGGGAGFQPSASCNVPQTAGMNTQPYYFDFNSNNVHPEDTGRLQSLAQNISSSHSNVKIVGNTDDRGSREFNMALGWRRANAVSSNLQQYGVNKTQITTTSNGAEKPIALGNSEDDYQCNRRVDAISH